MIYPLPFLLFRLFSLFGIKMSVMFQSKEVVVYNKKKIRKEVFFMTKKLVQIDFPADGPFGEEMSTAYKELAESIEKEPGLIWKIWTENAETKEAGGVYYFEDEESAKKYVEMHTKRLQSFGISGIRSKMFDVNEKLTAITKGPIK